MQGSVVNSLTKRGRTGDFRKVIVSQTLDMLCWNVEVHVNIFINLEITLNQGRDRGKVNQCPELSLGLR